MCEQAKSKHNNIISYPSSIKYSIQVGAREDAILQINGAKATAKEVLDLIIGKRILYVVYGCFSYTTEGKQEFTNWCVMRDPFRPTGDFTFCPYGNYPSEEKSAPSSG